MALLKFRTEPLKTSQLGRNELYLVLKVRTEDEGRDVTHNNIGTTSDNGIEGRLRKRQKRVTQTEQYQDCRFILGSVAEVERLWSIAKHVFTENRRSMTPQMFEAIMFLKINCNHWDANLVAEAIKLATLDKKAAENSGTGTESEANLD